MLHCFEPMSDKEKWRFTTRRAIDGSPVVVGDRVFVGSTDGRLYALNLADGKELWTSEAGGGFTGSPAVADGKLFIANDRGIVFCFGAP